MNKLMTTREIAAELGISRFRLEYLIETGVVPDARTKIAHRRIWTDDEAEVLRKILQQRSARHAAKKRADAAARDGQDQ